MKLKGCRLFKLSATHSAILLSFGGLLVSVPVAFADTPPPPATIELNSRLEAPPPSGEIVQPTSPAPNSLKDVVQQAVLKQPEVLYRWHAFQAADHEHDAAVGGYLPRVDYTAGRGKEQRDDPILKRDYTRNSSTLSLNQMLYDGFLTRNEVKRLDHARMTRLFELQDASENTALESMRAYLDVLRYRQLVGLAEDNYVQHRSVLEQIQLKVKAGVGRRVDLEQASGRFALAESNLLVDTSNLHDVSARFQRLIGNSPAREMAEAGELNQGLPPTNHAAQRVAQFRNPALRATIENMRSADAAYMGRAAPYQPRFDFRMRNDRGQDLNGIIGNTDNKTAEVVMTWNLFNGFSDVNRSRQYSEQRNVARDLRDKACRDMRQTLAIAYNDTQKLKEQLIYLDQHQLSIEKARDAYRKQFDIGQRTLLDVLDTENELFQSKRAYTNAVYDMQLAYARTHASMGSLLEVLGLSRIDSSEKKRSDEWAAEGDGAEHCPPEAPALYVANKQKLDERAAEILRELAPKSVASGAGAAPVTPTPDAGIEVPPLNAIGLSIKAWQAAWSSKNVTGYLDAYAKTFIPADGSSYSSWLGKRKAALERTDSISVEITDIKVELRDATHAVSTFTQSYRSGQFNDTVAKTLELEKIDGRWLIVGEMSKKAIAKTAKP